MNQRIVVPVYKKPVGVTAPKIQHPLAPTPPGVAPVPATPAPQVPKDPNALLAGDFLIAELSHKTHTIRIIKRTDPSQFIPFFDTCTCGYQARLYDQPTATAVAQGHIDWITNHPTKI